MNELIIKVFSFFIGLFLTLFLINYINIQNKKKENFEIIKLNKETFTNSSTSSSTSSSTNNNTSSSTNNNNIKIEYPLPHNNYKYMSISTYFDIKHLSNTEGRWYDIDINTSNLIDYSKSINQKDYFTFTKMCNLKNNKINNNGSKGVDLNGIELRGPKSFYYANNITTNELKEFSVIFSMRINEIKEHNNILFEMIGNTEEKMDDNKKHINYTYSIVNINIKPNNDNYNFILTIGNNVYEGNINNINKSLIRHTDILVIGLLYSETEITFLINKEMYKYKTNKTFTINLGSLPVLINKQGNIDMDLYNFTYYKSIIPIGEYLKFFKHNYHYLSGINKVLSQSSNELELAKTNSSNITELCIEQTKETDGIKINKRIDELEKNLTKCFIKNDVKKVEDNKNDIKPFDIKIIDDIKTTTNNFFSFLFE